MNSMGGRPSQKSPTRKKLLSKTLFQYSQGWYLLISYFEPQGNEVNVCDVRFVVYVPTLN